jgi:CRISPR-associated protein Cas2
MQKQFMVISYDISDNRRRTKIMKTLEDFGTHVQFSVFECRLKPNEFARLKKLLKPLVREPQDTIRVYFIGADDVGRIQIIGAGSVTEDRLFFLQ